MGQPLELDLSNNPISRGSALTSVINNFANHFGIAGNTYFSTPQYQAITFSSLAAVIQTGLNNYLDSKKQDYTFLRGIRFYLGLYQDTSGGTPVWQISLIVVPVCLDSQYDNGWPTCNFQFTPTDPLPQNSEIYVIQNGALSSITYNNALILMNNYYNNIQILRTDNAGDVFAPFDPTKDTKSIFFPFQEIESLYYHNLNTGNTPIANDLIYILTISVKNNIDNYVHSLAICPTVPSGGLHGIFTGNAADLANLCPPHCRDAMVNINPQTLLGIIKS